MAGLLCGIPCPLPLLHVAGQVPAYSLPTLGKYNFQTNRQEGISEQQAGILAFFSSVSKVVKYVSYLPSLSEMQTMLMSVIAFCKLLLRHT